MTLRRPRREFGHRLQNVAKEWVGERRQRLLGGKATFSVPHLCLEAVVRSAQNHLVVGEVVEHFERHDPARAAVGWQQILLAPVATIDDIRERNGCTKGARRSQSDTSRQYTMPP